MQNNQAVSRRAVRTMFAFGSCWLLLAAMALCTNRCAGEELDAGGPSGTTPAPPQSQTPPLPGLLAPGAAAAAAAPAAGLAPPSLAEMGATGGGAAAPWSVMPNMIGDLSSGTLYFHKPSQVIINPTPPPSLIVTPARFGSIPTGMFYKVIDDGNSLPVDRVFFDYQHYAGAVDDNGPSDLNHFIFGGEKTFFDKMASLEVRLPLNQALSADQPAAPATLVSGTEFGDLALIPKVVLLREDDWSLAAGLGVILPTARSSALSDVVIRNQSVHLQPYIGAQWQPNERCFTMFIAGCDFDTGGDPVIEGGTFDGQLFDQNLLYLDWKLGYWVYQNRSAKLLNGIAPTIELNYTTTITDGTAVNTAALGAIGPEVAGIGRWDNLDITAGAHFLLGKTILTVYGAMPLRNQYDPATGANSSFFSEFGIQLDRRF